MAGQEAAFTGREAAFADLPVPGPRYPATLSMGSQGGGPEAAMAGQRQETATGTGLWSGALWLTGVALFVVELNAGLDYVQARLAAWAPSSIGCIPAWGLATGKILEATFWNLGHLEATFQIMPFVTLPFLLVGLALAMRTRFGLKPERGSAKS